MLGESCDSYLRLSLYNWAVAALSGVGVGQEMTQHHRLSRIVEKDAPAPGS